MWSAGRIPEDGRAQLIALSAAGAEKLRVIEDQRTATIQGLLQDWSEDDVEQTAQHPRETCRVPQDLSPGNDGRIHRIRPKLLRS